MNGENGRVALVWRENFDTRLLARALFGEDKFTTLEIPTSLAQEDCDLKGKDDITV